MTAKINWLGALGLTGALMATATSAQTPASPAPPSASPPAPTSAPLDREGHPDFTGVWENARIPGEGEYIDGEDKRDLSFMKPWVLTEVRRREKASLDGNPVPSNGELCLPAGVPNIMQVGHDMQIIQKEGEILFLAEADHQVLRVRMNAQHPVNLTPSWFGDSIGHWEGGTLVIDTIGLNDKSLIDSTGTPHSERLHVTQRLTAQKDGRRIEVQLTLDDPLAFYKPWVYLRHFDKEDRESVSEYACAENNEHYVPDSKR